MKRGDSRAQNMSEYVILIGIVSLALIGIQIYMRRGLQGVVKTSADELFSQNTYEQKHKDTSVSETSTSSATIDASNPQIKTTKRLSAGGTTTITTNRTVNNTSSDSSTTTTILTE